MSLLVFSFCGKKKILYPLNCHTVCISRMTNVAEDAGSQVQLTQALVV